MGANYSKNRSEVVNETVTEMITNIVNNTLSSTTSVISANQVQDINFTGSSVNCDLNIRQDGTLKNKVYQSVNETKKTEIDRTIMNKIANDLTNKIDQKATGLSFFNLNMSEIEQNLKNLNYTNLSSSITNELAAQVNSNISFNQKQRINVVDMKLCETTGGKVEFTQNLDIDSVLENTLKSENVTKEINDVTNEVENIIENATTQTILGLDPFAILGIIIAIIVFIGLIAFFFMFGIPYLKNKKK